MKQLYPFRSNLSGAPLFVPRHVKQCTSIYFEARSVVQLYLFRSTLSGAPLIVPTHLEWCSSISSDWDEMKLLYLLHPYKIVISSKSYTFFQKSSISRTQNGDLDQNNLIAHKPGTRAVYSKVWSKAQPKRARKDPESGYIRVEPKARQLSK